MVSTGHTAVGVIVGIAAYKILGQGNPVTGLLISGTCGVLSHYLADSIPHGHFMMPKDFKKGILPVIVFDLFLSIAFFLTVSFIKYGFNLQIFYLLFAIGGSQLPDVIDGLIRIGMLEEKGLLKLERGFHHLIHWHGTGNKTLLLGPWDIWQAAMVVIALYQLIFSGI